MLCKSPASWPVAFQHIKKHVLDFVNEFANEVSGRQVRARVAIR